MLELEYLYEKIKSCKDCPNVQSEKVLKLVDKVNFKAPILIISEAMAAYQVRLSWISFFDVNGKVWNTWVMLEKFLKKLWVSLYPWSENCIYNTEIVHCFPWYINKNWKSIIRSPSKEEIKNCISKWFVSEEIDIINPDILILMWSVSYNTFYIHFLWEKPIRNLTSQIEYLKSTKEIDLYKGKYPIFPIQHASGANPRFCSMLEDNDYISLIKSYLNFNF